MHPINSICEFMSKIGIIIYTVYKRIGPVQMLRMFILPLLYMEDISNGDEKYRKRQYTLVMIRLVRYRLHIWKIRMHLFLLLYPALPLIPMLNQLI